MSSTGKAFTLIELLVVIVIIVLLTAVILPSLSGVRDRAAQIKELSALRSTLTAWNQYATDQKGALIPAFYGNPPLDALPAFYEDGKPIPTDVYGSQRAVVCRWPWRLAPYLGNDFRALTMQDGDDLRKILNNDFRGTNSDISLLCQVRGPLKQTSLAQSISNSPL